MKSIGNIYLCWRKGQSHRRHLVGIIRRNATEGVRFSYIKKNIQAAIQDGFSPYTEFPDVEKIYTDNVLDIFGQRLMKSERTDIQSFYDFWEIKPEFKTDKYYLLAHTQGMVTTDNFEFLADYKVRKDLSFVTDLASVRSRKIMPGSIKVGDFLTFETEPENEFDKYAVKVFKDGIQVGYIKKIHSRVFFPGSAKNLKIKVKALDQNGIISRIFVKVSF
ncbi:MAG TPA: hypothetical protein DHV48_00970 [Prolixibacteraceae bacterium]|nr:hypothetical protein [Prolixibacteraceae bacterium]